MIYLDYNATTPLDPAVAAVMQPYWHDYFGNPASIHHSMGFKAVKAVELAKQQIAGFLHCAPEEIVFTSGSTESINLALKGMAEFALKTGFGNHLITLKTEHKAVLETCKYLEGKGVEVTYLGVDESGQINFSELQENIRNTTFMICAMHANNETGVLHPIEKIAKVAEERGIIFFSDATQSVGKVRINLQITPIDMLCFSGHKIYGPKGVGVLIIRKNKVNCQPVPQIHGGSQQDGMRSGTLNVPGIVGIGEACAILDNCMESETANLRVLRDVLETKLLAIESATVNGAGTDRLPHVANVCFHNVDAENMLLKLDCMAFSNGSACTSHEQDPSHVLMAMGHSLKEIVSSVRFSLGRLNTLEEVEDAGDKIAACVQHLRGALVYID
jgi:cysteine desulfurase